MAEPTDDVNLAERLEDVERRLAAIAELASSGVFQRLKDAERRLAIIAELASGPVKSAGTPESSLVDAETRLIQIFEVATMPS